MNIAISERLLAAAEFVRNDRLTADVGTDHGYLPAFLVMNGRIKKAIASDIGEGPLANAAKTVEKYDLNENISLVLSDGLKNIPHNVEDIVIAGMGGTLISDILTAADWIKNENIHLVLQPMTHSYDVRKYLAENGFYIDKEKTLVDDGRIYIIISACYDGKTREHDEFYYYFGSVTPGYEFGTEYINKQLFYIRSRFEGLMKSGKTEEAEVFGKVLEKAKENGFI